MLEHLGYAVPAGHVGLEHVPEQVLGLLGDLVLEVVLGFQDEGVQVLHVVGLEGHRSVEHGVEHHSRTPDVCFEARVALVSDDLRCYVCRGPALFSHNFP